MHINIKHTIKRDRDLNKKDINKLDNNKRKE